MKPTKAALLLVALLLPLINGVAEGETSFRIEGEHFAIDAQVLSGTLSINRMHSWRLILTDQQGNPVEGARITFSGGMPDHDHGLPTAPVAEASPETGTYLVQGIRFHMPGSWLVEFSVTAGNLEEDMQLELVL